jgi:hypothetical protein
MIREALEYVARLAQSSAVPAKLDIPDPRAARFYAGDGKQVAIELPAPPRKHIVGQLDDLIRLAARFAGTEEESAEDADCRPVVWYDESQVVLVIDDEGHRCETATLPLRASDLFAVVCRMARDKTPLDWKGFIRFLRIDLAGALPPSVLLEIVRKVKFESGAVVKAETTRSRESLGREIHAAVSAEGDIPDMVTLSVPVYKTLGERDEYPVRCTVDVDPMAGTLRLVPFPDEVENAQLLAVGSIARRLTDQLPGSVPAYFGRP